jgi:hypothetical protein
MVNDSVQKLQNRVGGRPVCLGRSVVVKVTATKVVLVDGSEWRASDGYAWGSKPERGMGRFFEPRIEVVGRS